MGLVVKRYDGEGVRIRVPEGFSGDITVWPTVLGGRRSAIRVNAPRTVEVDRVDRDGVVQSRCSDVDVERFRKVRLSG